MAFTQVTVTGAFQSGGGTAVDGTVTFTPTEAMRNTTATTETTVAGPVVAAIVGGAMTASLAATDDPGTTPTGVTYQVDVRINRTSGVETYFIEVPFDGGALDLATVPRATTVTPAMATYLTQADADLLYDPLGGGGGGGGGVPDDGSVTNVKVATGAAISADKLADGTTLKVMTATERTKLSGIATGATANATDATLLARANHTGVQAISTVTGLQTALDALELVVNVKDHGATGDGSTDDTAALDAARDAAVANGQALYLPTGVYRRSTAWDLRYDGLHVYGSGRDDTFIEITGSNVAGVQLGRYRQRAHDFSVRYATPQTSSQTSANGVEFYKASWCDYRRISVFDAARSFYIPQVDYEIGPTDTLNNWMFSCVLDTLISSRFAIGGFRMDCYGAKGTGNVFTNIYINNKTTGGARGGCIESAASFQNFSELVVNQFNVEHVAPSVVSATVLLVTCYAPVFNSVHMEGITLGVANASLFRCVDSVLLTMNGFNVSFCTIDSAGGGAKSWFNMGNGCHLSLDGGHQESITVTNPSYSLGNFEAASTTGLVYARAVDVSAFTALGTGDAASITARLREVNDDWDHFAHNQLSAGVETLPRDLTSSTAASTNTGNLRLTYFTARKTGSSTQVRLLSGGTAAAATPTLARIGLYEIDATGNGTLVASTASDTALFATTFLAYTKSWSTPYTLVAGRRYALAVLVVTAATAPTLSGIAAGLGSELAIAPRLTGSLGSQTDLPGSFTAGSVATSGSRVYAALI